LRATIRDGDPSPAQLVDRYLAESFMLTEDWEALPPHEQEEFLFAPNRAALLAKLVDHGLLTEYQSGRIQAGTTFGMVLGNYRILDRIGAGGMAVVFRAEHVDLRHIVAIKVLPSAPGQDSRIENRFFAEMRTIARLRHPNIITAIDAGRLTNPDAIGTSYRYLVMEYVPGRDLEEYVLANGPLPVGRACSLIYQVASALAETHKLQMVHRDIKPSNIMVTCEEQAKLLDFGLSRQFEHRVTSPGTVLGTVDFMAPEQARDASTVDIRADIYGLGGTLFYTLTGRLPFPQGGSPVETLTRRITSPAPSLLAHLPHCPPELNRVVERMMALDPDDRFPEPQAVMQALLRFVSTDAPAHRQAAPLSFIRPASRLGQPAMSGPRVLVVDDEEGIRDFAKHVLGMLNLPCDIVENGEQALCAAAAVPYDLVLLDLCMPDMSGSEVLRQLRASGRCPNQKIIILSGQSSPDDMTQMLQEGADDFLSKPFSLVQFQGRVRNALRLKSAQDRSGRLNQELAEANAQLEQNLRLRDIDLVTTRRALVLGLARLVEQRDARFSQHVSRMQRYCRALAEAAKEAPTFHDLINNEFVNVLETCVPLHDVGKVGLPDHILMKGGTLTPEERLLMQAHTTCAAETLHAAARANPVEGSFLRTVIDVIRHHHERFDGTGYPDRLTGTDIPLAARIVAICDVYDALRSRKPYKPALSHTVTVQIITEGSTGQFDPDLLAVFRKIAAEFETIYADDPD
jgi:response regulator RpfG family c-di-GMP phosphodiesterase/serine/threonine protein kinase